MSFGDTETTVLLDKSPITLIVGKNGVGKSSICEALCFVLFGKAFRNVNKSGLINNKTKKNCLCEIEFSIFDNSHKVVRGIKPDIFEIYTNNELIDQPANTKDYQQILENQILKMNYDIFTQILMLGKTAYTPFLEYKPR
jgi:DNA repair exonuclease SbcCD ATPase subunit